MGTKSVMKALLVVLVAAATSIGVGTYALAASLGPAGEEPVVAGGTANNLQLDTGATMTATILAPSAAMGDFGASLGNVWDMDSTADVQIVPTRVELTMAPLPGTIVRGYAPREMYTFYGIGLYGSPTVPIPTAQYHHAIYRLRIASQGTCATNGLVAYSREYTETLKGVKAEPVYSYPFLPHVDPMNCAFGTFGIYYVDMASNDNGGPCPTWKSANLPSDPSVWLAGQIKAFGIVPHEYWAPGTCAAGGGPAYYDLDFVYLTGDIVAREQDDPKYRYTLRWQIVHPRGATVTSTIMYKEMNELQLADDAPSCSRVDFHPPNQWPVQLPPIDFEASVYYLPAVIKTGSSGPWQDFEPVVQVTEVVQGVTELSYQLDFSDDSVFLDGKSYYLCIETDDGTSQHYTVSSAPVIRVPVSPIFGGCG